MQSKLTVIMPCYNCASTLEEAVASIFDQKLDIPFEVVMVDDGSTDNTREMIKMLAGKHSEIKYFFHKNNRGGGAARNTAVENSTSNRIFCLDSDDILPSNVLPKMVKLMDDRKCDGVLFEESRFFMGTDKSKISSSFNVVDDKPILLGDLISGERGSFTMVNFLYTKKAWADCGGYPTHHGFDTQGFGYRFLAKGLSAIVCPETYYLHRRANKQKSYFERVYESGEYSRNMYLIYEEFFYLLSAKTRRLIIDYPIFSYNKLGNNNLASAVSSHYISVGEEFWQHDNKNNLKEYSFEEFANNHKDSSLAEDVFCLGLYYYRMLNFDKALEYFKKSSDLGIKTDILSYCYHRAELAALPENSTLNVDALSLKFFTLKRQKAHLNPGIFFRALVIVKKRLIDIKDIFVRK